MVYGSTLDMTTTVEGIDLVHDETVLNIVRTALFAALMGAFAYVAFPYPLSPAPVTLQVLGVFLAGIMLGPIWGSLAMLLYVFAGALGAPVFSMGTAGIGAIVSEQGGYLLAFPIAAFVIGWVTHGGRSPTDPHDRHPIRLLAAMVAGVVIIYLFGVIGMMVVLSLSVEEALIMGALVFVPAEILKIAAALGIVRSDRLAAR